MSAVALPAAALLAALQFSIPEGATLNEFYRDGPIAAHVVLRPGPAPRIVFAFPAGNSGAALWLEARGATLTWQPDVTIEPATRRGAGGELRGVSAVISASGGPVSIREAVVGSIRVIRDFDDRGVIPSELTARPRRSGRNVIWERARLDGRGGYVLALEVVEGELEGGKSQPILLSSGPSGQMRLRVTALTGDPPLMPLDEGELVTAEAAPDARLRDILAYLSYREKLLAGSWRFDTYFGRDTLMSLRLLSPVLKPEVMEAGIGAVLERLDAAGEVAHEEAIGEFALLERRRSGLPLSDAPILDYKMVDDDFMLPAVAAHYLLETPEGQARAAAFLARAAGGGATNGARLVRNFRFVTAATSTFAREPVWRNLVQLKPGQHVGNWRDSEEGLGGGRFPYDINGVLAPAALDAIAKLVASGLLSPYLDAQVRSELERAAAMRTVWIREAPRLFEVEVPPAVARKAVVAYGHSVNVDAAPAIARIGSTPLWFRAVALDGAGETVPVLNSDESFALLFLDPPAAEAERIAVTLTREFPAGLLTGVGLVVANPAYAPTEVQPQFDRNHYHGTVIWSWQHALLRAGLDRQLARDELPASTRTVIRAARERLLAAMAAADELRGSELWSWSQTDGRYEVVPFGQALGHRTESNAAQLWSAVHLAWR